MEGGGFAYCESCRLAASQTECKDCQDHCPALMAENVAAWRLWGRVNTQWRVGVGGVYGLDYNAVAVVAEIYGLEITPGLFEKLRVLEDVVLAKVLKV